MMSATALKYEESNEENEDYERTLREVRLLSRRRLIYACILYSAY
jgi:hypothetical protein